jgi:hypothetical protein
MGSHSWDAQGILPAAVNARQYGLTTWRGNELANHGSHSEWDGSLRVLVVEQDEQVETIAMFWW